MNDRARHINELTRDFRNDPDAAAYILGYLSPNIPTEALHEAHESFLRHQAAIETVLRARTD